MQSKHEAEAARGRARHALARPADELCVATQDGQPVRGMLRLSILLWIAFAIFAFFVVAILNSVL